MSAEDLNKQAGINGGLFFGKSQKHQAASDFSRGELSSSGVYDVLWPSQKTGQGIVDKQSKAWYNTSLVVVSMFWKDGYVCKGGMLWKRSWL
jgi:hypothetical protein